MSFMIKSDATYSVVGDDAGSAANNIRAAGEDMYSHLRNLVASGQLTGDGIQQALEMSHARWNSACDDLAMAEQRFGQQCYNTQAGMSAADQRGAGFFS